jgi:hypothetical protein
MYSSAVDYKNFLRVDDEGNEVVVKYHHKHEEEKGNDQPADNPKKFTRDELIQELDRMIESDEKLPDDAHIQQLTFYDLLRYMLLISNILKKGNL